MEALFGGSPSREMVERIAQARGESPDRLVTTLAYMFSGPYPPPEMLEAYDRVLPGLADRIVRQGESQTAHRQQIERDLLAIEREDQREFRGQSRLGLLLGFGVAIFGMLAAIAVTAIGHPVVGGVAFISDLGLLAGVFVYGSRRRESDDPNGDGRQIGS